MAKNIVITGGSSGIGVACAEAAVASGHRVALVARSQDKLDQIVAKLGEENAIAVQCDVTKPAEQEAMFEKVLAHFGTIDAVFANAGLGASATGTEHGDVDNFHEMILVNNFAVTVTCKFAIPHLRKTKGQLVLIGSQAGHVALSGSVYSATKWFIRGYAKNLSNELIEHGVRVTSIDPGMVDTPFFDEPKPTALRPEDIGKAFAYIIDLPEHARIAELEIYPTVGAHHS
ncbi:SDR family oxidoreductase [Erythrobacter rubeus]|uniref:SDR family oxidoreductase n=1 Tax=Erythrobacter rubeus TaxID=2760803 RepID=A0ABR8KMW5_9SPHN|nr:SDR family oxidoreductase [Erythrobacter rubeus]MBD2841926.1 SDR family oxidoreductase [Erythrobacter rubeus]